MKRKLLLGAAAALLLLVMPFLVLKVGTTARTACRPAVRHMNVGSATLRDASYPLRRALLLPHAASPRETRTFRLRYNSCLYYRDDGGRRVDLFYTPRKDALLLVPGGSYERTTKLEKRHGQ